MSNKLILVPEDMYQSLIAQKCEATDNVNLEFTKNRMNQMRDVRGKNLSSKNVQYNQELRRFLKQRREEKEKPVKVKLTNGLNIITKPNASNNGAQSAIVDENGDLDSIEDDSFHSVGDSESEYKTPRHSRREKFNKEKFNTEKKNILLNYLLDNKEKFGITERGQVMRTGSGNPVKGAVLGEIVERIVDPSLGSVSPPGTGNLRGKIQKDRYIIKLLGTKKGLLPLPTQEGHGFNFKKRPSSFMKFRPSKWL
jgi:hypothetical protein